MPVLLIQLKDSKKVSSKSTVDRNTLSERQILTIMFLKCCSVIPKSSTRHPYLLVPSNNLTDSGNHLL